MAGILIDVFERTRAVPPEEFPAAEVLFSLRFEALWVHIMGAAVFGALVGVDALRRIRSGLGRQEAVALLGLLLAVLGMGLSFFHGLGALVAAAGLYLAHVVDHAIALSDAAERRSPLGRNAARATGLVGELSWRSLARRAPELLGLPAAAFALTVGLELVLFTADFAGELFSVAAFNRFAAAALGSAVLTGARVGVELVLLLAIVKLIVAEREGDAPDVRRMAAVGLVSLGWLSLSMPSSWSVFVISTMCGVLVALQIWLTRLPAAARLMAAPVAMGLYLWARTSDLFLAALADEVAALGLTWMVHLLFGVLAVLFASWTAAGISAVLAEGDHTPDGMHDVLALLVVAFLCPPLTLLARRRGKASLRRLLWRASGPTLAFSGLVLAVLLELNYPSFTDYSQFLQKLYSLLIGYAVLGALLVGWFALVRVRPARRRRRAVAHGVLWTTLAASAAVYLGFGEQQVPRMIAHQYSKVARQTIDRARIVPEPVRIPLGDDDRPGEAPRLAHQGHFPALASDDRSGRTPDPASSATAPPARAAFYRARRPPIVLIVWDAARHDHMSAYGYERDTTPGASELAEDGIVFDNAYASATGTTASMRHLLSGRLSSRYMLSREHPPFFTGALFELGYDAFLLNIIGSDFNGVSREAFLRNQPLESGARDAYERATVEFGAYEEQAKTDAALDLLDETLAERQDREHPGDGIFMYLHSTSTHWPWERWDDSPDYGDGYVDLYDEAMFHSDVATRRFLDGLRERGLYDDAIVVLTADHGTGLYEHGRWGGFQPYQEQIRVPLIIKAPGFAPRRVSTAVSGIDIAPTLIGLFRPGAKSPYDGFSLTRLMAGGTEAAGTVIPAVEAPTSGATPIEARRYLFSLSAFEDALALVDLETQYKLIVHRTDRYEQLYDLADDSAERHNLADQQPEVVERYMDFLRRLLWHRRDGFGNPYHYRPRVVD